MPNSIKVSIDGDGAAVSYMFQYTPDSVTNEVGRKGKKEYSDILSRVVQ